MTTAARAQDRARSTVRERVLLVVVVLVGTAVTWVRVPDAHRDAVWAEDAQIFLDEALRDGSWSVLFEGYAGYQHFLPRIVTALVVDLLPLSAYALAVFAVCSVLTGLVAGAVFWLSRDVIAWIPARLAAAALTFVLPLAGVEVLGNMADLHSYCQWLVPWILLARHRSWIAASGWGLVVLACALTEIQTLLFAPLLLLRLRERRAWPSFAGLAVGGAVQLVAFATVDRVALGHHRPSPVSLVQGWLINGATPLIETDVETQRAWLVEHGPLVGAAVAAPLLLAALVALVVGSRAIREMTLVALVASAAAWGAGAYFVALDVFDYAALTDEQLAVAILNVRYGVVAGWFLALCLPLAVSAAVERWRGRGAMVARLLGVAMLVGMLVVLVSAIDPSDSLREHDVPWSLQVERAVVACDGGASEVVLANPPLARTVVVDCADVDG